MLSLHLLGAHGLHHADQDIGASIQYRKAWALLAYLAVENDRRHPREHLAQLLWPQLALAPARTNLRQVLANLNRVFDACGVPGLLDLGRDAVTLVPQSNALVDVLALQRFAGGMAAEEDLRQVERVCERFGAELLGELAFPDCAEYEEWLQLARGRLVALGIEALQRIAEAQHAAGRGVEAIATARRLVALDEWNEAHHRLLMKLLVAAGQLQQALSVYDALCRSLREELDSEPEPATAALHAAIESAAKSGGEIVFAATGGHASGLRRWFTAVHCELHDVPADQREAAIAGIAACLRTAGAVLLPTEATRVTGCFCGEPDAGGAQRTALDAARAAVVTAEACGARVTIALCSGLARMGGDGLVMLGNPVEWAARLATLAAGGRVVLCDAVQRKLAPAFETRRLRDVLLEDVAQPITLWELGRERRDAGQVRPSASHAPAAIAAPSDLQTQRVPVGGHDAGSGARAWLTVMRGAERGRRIVLRGEPTVIGRASDADVQIPHRTVSRHHCMVWLDGERFRIRDLGATNRTCVNDATVQEVELDHGDRVVLGDAVMQFAWRSDPPTMPVGHPDAAERTGRAP